jgi:C1A family cysteine protease
MAVRHAALEAANRRALPGWRDLGTASFDRVVAELDAGRPVILTVAVVAAAWYHDGALVDAPGGQKTPGNHAVLAVGALDAPQRLIVKNSWGPSWGDGGYGLLTRRYYDHYALRAHTLEAV